MVQKSFKIEFDGYWLDQNKGGIPNRSGLYCVYSSVFDTTSGTVDLKKLIYIGESANVRKRLDGHEKAGSWHRHLKSNETLCFSFGGVPASDRVRCEAALIFKHKPPVNTEYVKDFLFDKTVIELSGKVAMLSRRFSVEQSPST